MKQATLADLVYDAKKQANETREVSGLKKQQVVLAEIHGAPFWRLRREVREG